MACPVCGNHRSESLATIAFQTLPDFLLPDHYDVVACKGCGFVYNEAEAVQADYDEYYELTSKYDTKGISGAGGLSEIDKRKYEGIVSFLQPFLPSKDVAIIDIGCAKGGLLASLREKGFTNLYGLDPSACPHDGREDLGVRVFTGSILDFSLPRVFGVALFTSVLEHIRDLRAAARKLFSTLETDGLLLIEVPDASRYAEFRAAPFYRFDFEHINHFSAFHVQNLMATAGFELVRSLQLDLRVSKKTFSPTVLCLLRKTGKIGALRQDFSLRDAIARYVQQSRDAESFETINGIVDSQIPLCVWGLGAHTARLLKQSRLSEANIRAFVDNDPHKKGKHLLGKPVVPSTAIFEFNDGNTAMVIGSVLYEEEMRESLLNSGWSGKIFCLT
jgi:SAM-dependent methyltransferase